MLQQLNYFFILFMLSVVTVMSRRTSRYENILVSLLYIGMLTIYCLSLEMTLAICVFLLSLCLLFVNDGIERVVSVFAPAIIFVPDIIMGDITTKNVFVISFYSLIAILLASKTIGKPLFLVIAHIVSMAYLESYGIADKSINYMFIDSELNIGMALILLNLTLLIMIYIENIEQQIVKNITTIAIMINTLVLSHFMSPQPQKIYGILEHVVIVIFFGIPAFASFFTTKIKSEKITQALPACLLAVLLIGEQYRVVSVLLLSIYLLVDNLLSQNAVAKFVDIKPVYTTVFILLFAFVNTDAYFESIHLAFIFLSFFISFFVQMHKAKMVQKCDNYKKI